jgi:hypothetical protein
MDGVISIPIAIWGFFAIPDLPHTTRAFYWTEDVSGRQISTYLSYFRPFLGCCLEFDSSDVG